MSTTRDAKSLHEASDRYVLHLLRPSRPRVFTRSSGCRVWDAEGREYLDGISGSMGVAMVGHAHPHVRESLARQFGELPDHFFIHDSPPLIEFAERISAIAPNGPTRTYLCPGGGEGIDAAVKLAMRVTGRTEVVSLHGAYHGASLIGMSLCGIPSLREWFPGAGRWPGFQQVASPDPYRPSLGQEEGDWRPAARALEATLEHGTYNNVAAFVLELVQGPNGHVEFPHEYAQEVARICAQHDVLLIVDEVQTGLARCGATWACNLYDVRPDILVIGKAFGGGFPFGAVIARAELITPEIEQSAWHILTFGNNVLQATAGNAVLDIVEEENLVERAVSIGKRARARFTEMAQRYEVIGDIRGPGAFIVVDLVEDRETRAPATTAGHAGLEHALDIGLLTWMGGPGNALKFKPPLTTSDEDIDLMLDRYDDVIGFIDRMVAEGRQQAGKVAAH